MSLINQVLKDLEKRHAGAGEVRGEARAVRPLPEHVSRRSLWIALGLIAATAMAGGAWSYLAYPDPTAVPPIRSARIAGDSITIAPPGVAAPAALPRTSMKPATPIAREAARPVTPRGRPTSANAALLSPMVRATTGSAAAQSATLAPNPAAKPTRKATLKDNGAHRSAKAGLAGTQSAEDPEAGGVEGDSNIAKQVLPPSERERAEGEFRRGMAALQAGDAGTGEDRLRAALAIDPLADNARQALLGLYVERGRREDAEQLLEDRLRLDRKHAGFAMALARLQLEHDANGDALITLQRSLAYGEASPDYQVMLANSLGRVGRHKEAAERFEMAAGLAPRNPLWLMGFGVELRADGRPEQARAAFRRARELGGLTPQLVAFVDQQLRELK